MNGIIELAANTSFKLHANFVTESVEPPRCGTKLS